MVAVDIQLSSARVRKRPGGAEFNPAHLLKAR
jgi:hypothetical protein